MKLIRKYDVCKNNPKKCFPLDVSKHTRFGFAMFIKYTYSDDKEQKQNSLS